MAVERLTLFADVILPLPVSGTFTYRVPYALNDAVKEGKRVVVQFGSRRIYTALIRKIHQKPPARHVPKYILSILDEAPIVSDIQFDLWDWIASYYLCHLGEVMNAALPSVFKLASESKVVLNPLFSGDTSQLNEKELLLMEALGNQKTIAISDVMKILDQQKVIPFIKTMIDKGMILLEEEIKDKYRPKKDTFIALSDRLVASEEMLRENFDLLEKRAPRQLEVLMTFIHMTGYTQGEAVSINRSALLKNLKGGGSALDSLIKKEIFILTEKQVSRIDSGAKGISTDNIKLTKIQGDTLVNIRNGWHEKDVVLLHGVTSSGKTEIYIKLIQEAIDTGKQVLYLLPEIALTTQIISRLKKYFGDRIGVYHSRFNEQEKAEIWNRTIENQYDVILGARSALFAPFTNLGLVIVDEEHDSSFKQYDPAPRYNGRDAALFLAHLFGAKALLGSATPSLESYFNARQGKYMLVELFQRYGNFPLPEMQVVDIKNELRQGKMKSHFSSVLLARLEQALDNKEQTILFQNRRGFSLRLECEVCHWMPSCKNCDVTLVYHKQINQLRCHYCGFVTRVPEKCPECNSTQIHMKGFGTQRVEEDLQIMFPEARIARMDLDTTRSKHGHQKIITDFENQNIDILVGTQMVTKGLDFDHVSTVCILNADNMLSYPDFRSAERSYQLMAQVSGRSGRKKRRGEVIVQTWQPSNEIIRDVVANDYQAMYLKQLNERNRFKYPPFNRLIILRLKHKKSDKLNKASSILAADLRNVFGKRILGPEYPMVSRIMNLYIKQIMIKLERGGKLVSMKEQLKETIEVFSRNKEFSGVRVIIDVDPV
ncbi:MAG: primosomal protein N' [Bacteroidales bacterium]|nr:primosomal protein N' [Bacteroidota bacterium]MBL6950375.1 primosomal protein N' [Bacteroidales bacterium]